MLQTAALTYGAQGGLAAESFTINQMLQRYEPQLDATFNFAPLVMPVGDGQTLMRPPIVTSAQMAFALADNGQVARETSCIYQITEEAQLASAPPNWRSYLVRSWSVPMKPADADLPRTKQEAAYWSLWVAQGWAAGEAQAVEIYQDDLGRLERDLVGMARTGCCCAPASWSRLWWPLRTRLLRVAGIVCMSMTRSSASPISQACRVMRAIGSRARGARNETEQ
jgi:defect-in-organelle-trafficking protein DotC